MRRGLRPWSVAGLSLDMRFSGVYEASLLHAGCDSLLSSFNGLDTSPRLEGPSEMTREEAAAVDGVGRAWNVTQLSRSNE